MFVLKKQFRFGIIPLVIALIFLAAESVYSGTFYLDPDSTFITSGVGTEFVLDLKVDADVVGLKLYEFTFTFDKARLDTVSIVEGPLMKSGGTTMFYKLLEEDSTILRVQSLILGYGLAVDGPGTLATIRLKATGTGTVMFNVNSLIVHDVDNDPMTATGKGAVAFINAPPTNFDLISPTNLASPVLPITDSLRLVWHPSTTAYHGDYVSYDLLYGTDPTFTPAHTTTSPNLVDTFKVIPCASLVSGQYYWKVKAHNTLGYETWSTGIDWSFNLTVASYPGSFNLLTPVDAEQISLPCVTGLFLNWSDAGSIIPNDTIIYRIYFGPTASLPAASTYDTSVKIVSQIVLPESTLSLREWHYWRVKATNRIGYDTLSINTLSFMTYIRGDAKDDGNIDLLDILYLITYKFKGGPPPSPLITGDANGDENVDLLDILNLITFKFKGGSAPYCP
jgi:hypothetical protein